MTTILHRCAWCPPEPVPEGVIVSHGICQRCVEKMLGTFKPEPLADPVEFTPRPGSYYDHDRFATG